MKNQLRLFVSFLLVVFFFSPLFSQLEVISDQTTGSTVYTFELPPLKSKTKHEATPAFYKQLLIFGDGNFHVDSTADKGSVDYIFGEPFSAFITGYNSRLYSTGVYGGGEDEPPQNRVGPIAPPAGVVGQTKAMVDTNRYLRIFRNVEVKPGDPFIIVVSVKNPTNNALNGLLTFMYNGKLRTINHTLVNTLPEYSTFKLRENLFYRPDVGETSTYYYSGQSPIDQYYNNLWATQIFNLPPGSEVHYFIDIVGEESMMDLFKSTSKAEMDFAAALSLSFFDDVQFFPNYIPDSLREEVLDLGLSTFLTSLSATTPDSISSYDINTDATFSRTDDLGVIQTSTTNIVDYYKSTASLTKSHDPNFMLADACDCPATSDRYQIFTTVQCENSGYGETDHIYIDIKLPPGIDSSDVSDTPIAYHPFKGASDQIRLVKLAKDSVRWELLNFGLEGTPMHGVGDPRTFANVKFNMFSSIVPADLDSIFACIRFDKLDNDPVCTVPIAVNLLDAVTANEGGILACTPGTCDDDKSNIACEDCCCWFWWLLGLLAVLLILLIIWWRRRQATS